MVFQVLFEWIATLPVGQVLGWGSAVIGGALAVWKGWPLFRKVVKALHRFIALVDTLTTLPDDLAFIKHELQANSGKTVKDIAVRTETAVGGALARLDDLTKEVAHVRRQGASLKTSQAKANRALAEHIDKAQKGNE